MTQEELEAHIQDQLDCPQFHRPWKVVESDNKLRVISENENIGGFWIIAEWSLDGFATGSPAHIMTLANARCICETHNQAFEAPEIEPLD